MKKALISALILLTYTAVMAKEPAEPYKNQFNGFGIGAEAGYSNAPSVGLQVVNRFAENWHFTLGVAGLFDADYTESELTTIKNSQVQPGWADYGVQKSSHYAEIFVKLGRKIFGRFGLEAGAGFSFQSRSHIYYNNSAGIWYGTEPTTQTLWQGMAAVTYEISPTIMLSAGGHTRRGFVAGVTVFAF